MTYRRSDASWKKLSTLPAFLLLLLCASSSASFASTLACNQYTLDVAIGNTIACGTIIYDFTNTGAGFAAVAAFGTPLQASDLIVNPSYNAINFSVNPNSYTLDFNSNPIAASKGLFYADGTNTGYVVYTIPFNVSITGGYWFSGITTNVTNLFFGNNNGGQDSIDVQKIVQFDNPNDPLDPNNPYAYSADANTGQIDTSDGSGDVIIPFLTSGFNTLDPFSPSSMSVIDTITLNATTNDTVAVWVGPAGFNQNFATPEPLTLFTLGSSLVLIGILGRKRRITAAKAMEQE